MSMLDSFFNKGFKAAKCKTLLKLTIPRIKLIRNRREAQIKQMRREIAKLLETGQEATARIRVEHIIREEKMMAAQEILELFCELIAVRLPIIEAQKECPLDLKEAISSVCFAAPRCSDLTELQQVQMLFVSKYGKEFVAAASELMPDCGVNRKLVELLSVRAPSPETKLKLLKEIAEEHEVEWDPATTEADLFKSHEDLLDGPTNFGGGSKLPLPEKRNEVLQMLPISAQKEQSDSDSEYEKLDFPEVPTVLLRPAPSPTPNVPSGDSQSPENAPEVTKSASYVHTSQDLPYESENAVNEKAVSKRNEHPAKGSSTVVEGKQFSPNDSPQHATESDSMKWNKNYTKESGSSANAPSKLSDVDLQDVLAAAQAAADSAERAASAARSAASLAQLRITELTRKTSEQPPESPSDNPFHANSPETTPSMEKPQFDHQNSSTTEKPQFDHQNSWASSSEDFTELQRPETSSFFSPDRNSHQPERFPSLEKPRFDHQNSTVSSCGDLTELQRPETSPFDRHNHDQDHQQMRLPSMEDDPYYSYPNLFTPQKPDPSSGSQPYSDNSRPGNDS